MSSQIRSAVTVSLVPEAAGGPFVYWHDLQAAVREASELGFDAIELFAPGPEDVPAGELSRLLLDRGLKLAAVGTGAGWVKHKLSLTDPEGAQRQRAIAFVKSMIDYGVQSGEPLGQPAPAIIGSMQGRWAAPLGKEAALHWLKSGLEELADHATRRGVQLFIEPLNRYETNLLNTLCEGSTLLARLDHQNVKLLADLFHMNIEERDVATALIAAGNDVGHVHFVDSNRRPAGCGHLDHAPVAAALKRIGFAGYASAEALPWPDSSAAALQTILAFRRLFR